MIVFLAEQQTETQNTLEAAQDYPAEQCHRVYVACSNLQHYIVTWWR